METRVGTLLMCYNIQYVLQLGCRYQFLQEPISELYCRPSTSTIFIGCTVISKISDPSVLIVWFVNTGSGERRLQPGQVENLSQSNSTYRIITNIVGVRNNPSSIYWCRPQFSNGIFLKSSQAITIRSVPRIYTPCRGGDVFSSDSTFCADQTESIPPPSSRPSITDSSYGPTKSKDESTNPPPIYITRTSGVAVTDSIRSAIVSTTSESTDIVVTQDNVALVAVLPILGLLCLIVLIQSIVNVVLFLKLKQVKPVKEVITRQKSEVRADRNINTISAASYAYPLSSNTVVVNGNQQAPSTTTVSSNQSPNATVVNGNQQPPDSDSSSNYDTIQQCNTTETNTAPDTSSQSSRNPPQLYGNYLIPTQTLQASTKGYAPLLKETMATHNIYTCAQTKDTVYY